jgi:KUP system potassium uptake protein
MENLDVPATIRNSLGKGLIGTGEEVTYFLDRVLPIPTSLPGMVIWRERLFAFMTQNSLRATKFYRIPAKQVIEIGFQIEI